MSHEQQNNAVTQHPKVVSDELSDNQLEKVAAGSRPNCSTPLDVRNPKACDTFNRH